MSALSATLDPGTYLGSTRESRRRVDAWLRTRNLSPDDVIEVQAPRRVLVANTDGAGRLMLTADRDGVSTRVVVMPSPCPRVRLSVLTNPKKEG